MQVEKPIVAPRSPSSDQFSAGLRQLLLVLGAFAVAKGWLGEDELATIVPAIVIVGSFAWGQLKTRRRAAEVSTLANFVPDDIACKKGGRRG